MMLGCNEKPPPDREISGEGCGKIAGHAIRNKYRGRIRRATLFFARLREIRKAIFSTIGVKANSRKRRMIIASKIGGGS